MTETFQRSEKSRFCFEQWPFFMTIFITEIWVYTAMKRVYECISLPCVLFDFFLLFQVRVSNFFAVNLWFRRRAIIAVVANGRFRLSAVSLREHFLANSLYRFYSPRLPPKITHYSTRTKKKGFFFGIFVKILKRLKITLFSKKRIINRISSFIMN